MNKLTPIANNLMSYCQKHLGYDQSPQLSFEEDQENANQILGKTAYYSPEEKKIVVFISNRHPKDILRSIAHELIHHDQNCRGEFNKSHSTDPGYAQKDPHLRNMEKEAYLKGNMLFRDWEDQNKTQQIKENKLMKEDYVTSVDEIKELIKKEIEEGFKSRRAYRRDHDQEDLWRGNSEIDYDHPSYAMRKRMGGRPLRKKRNKSKFKDFEKKDKYTSRSHLTPDEIRAKQDKRNARIDKERNSLQGRIDRHIFKTGGLEAEVDAAEKARAKRRALAKKQKKQEENFNMNDENIKEIIRNELREAAKNGQEIDEGLFDRIRSRVAGAGSAIKGMAGNVKRAGKYVGSGDTKDLEGGVNAKAAYRQRKADSMIKASAKKILAVHKELLNDLTKTGLMDKSGDSDVVNVNMIKQGLARLNQGITMMTKAASAEGAEKIDKIRNPEATNEEELEEAEKMKSLVKADYPKGNIKPVPASKQPDVRVVDKDYPDLKGKVKPVPASKQPRREHKKNKLEEGSMKKTSRFQEKQRVTHKEDKDLGTGTVVSRQGNTVQVKWSSGQQQSHDHNMLKPVNETNKEDLRIPENADALNEALYGNRRSALNKRLVEWAKK